MSARRCVPPLRQSDARESAPFPPGALKCDPTLPPRQQRSSEKVSLLEGESGFTPARMTPSRLGLKGHPLITDLSKAVSVLYT